MMRKKIFVKEQRLCEKKLALTEKLNEYFPQKVMQQNVNYKMRWKW